LAYSSSLSGDILIVELIGPRTHWPFTYDLPRPRFGLAYKYAALRWFMGVVLVAAYDVNGTSIWDNVIWWLSG
jgi:hypothetical protein